MFKIFCKYKQLSLPAKATIWFVACSFFLKGISFITGPLFTRLLPSDEYGKLSVFVSYEQIVLILATWEIQLGAYQKGIFKFKEDERLFTSATQCLINILTLVFFAVIVVILPAVVDFTGMNNAIILSLCIYLMFYPAYQMWLTRKKTIFAYKPAVTVTILYTLANVLIPLFAVIFIDKTANVKFIATLIGSAAICFIFYLRNGNYLPLFQNKDKVKVYWKFLIAFEGPVVLHSLSYFILSQADRIMISKMVGDSEAAFYSVAYSIAVVVSLFQTSINQTLLPWRYKMLEEKNYKKIETVTHELLLGFAALIFLFVLVAPEAVKLLFTADYHEAIWCIPPISSSIFFVFLYTVFVNIESYYEKTKYIVYVSVPCGIINIILNYFFIQLFGYVACAYTTLASYVLFSLGHYYFMKKVLKEQKIKERIINPFIALAIGFGLIVGTIIITLLYNYVFYRYLLFAIVLIVMIILRDKLKKIITTLRSGK